MPYEEPGSLSDAETYSVTAYLLYANGLIEDDAVMDRNTLPQVVMPARAYYRQTGSGVATSHD